MFRKRLKTLLFHSIFTLKFIVLEAIIIFLIVLFGMLFEVWRTASIFQNSVIDEKVLIYILQRATIITLLFTVVYQVSKSVLFYLLSSLSVKLSVLEDKNVVSLIFDTTVLASLIFAFVPVRPILQDAVFTGSEFNITEAFAKYDLVQTLIILIPLGIIASVAILLLQRNRLGLMRIVVVFITIAVAGYINSAPNFYARVYEARAAWINSNYPLLLTKSGDALMAASTNHEKAVSYYWMGVASNRMNNSEDAVNFQKKAISQDSEYGPPYSSLALAYLAQKEYAEASEAAKLCVKYDPEYAWCYYALSGYYLQGVYDVKSAEDNLLKAIELTGRNEEFKQTLDQLQKAKPIIENYLQNQ